MYALGYPLLSAVTIIDSVLLIYTFIIIAAAVLTWVNPDPLNPIVQILRKLTEPVMDRIRPMVPLVGGLDLTPVVLIAVIFFIRSGILPIFYHFAASLTN